MAVASLFVLAPVSPEEGVVQLKPTKLKLGSSVYKGTYNAKGA